MISKWLESTHVLAWILIVFGLLIDIPSAFVVLPPGILFLGIANSGYVLHRKAREGAMRRQQGRSWLD